MADSATFGDFVDSKRAAAFLGVTVGTIHKWCHYNRIPFHRFGKKCVRFNLAQLDQWAKAQAVKPKTK